MTATSPFSSDTDLAAVTVKVNGVEMSGNYTLVSVYISSELNKIPTARVTLQDGDVATGEFAISDSADFAPGATVEILAGYQATGAQTSIFSGIVVKHGIRLSAQHASLLEIECKDKAIAMTIGRNSAYYTKQKDSDVMTTLIGNSSGLTATVTATIYQHPELVQYYCTDWDFMLMRAEANGMVVNVNAATVTVGKPNTSASATLGVGFGDSIVSMNIEMDARYQLPKAQAIAWDPSTQAIITANSSDPSVNAQGNITSKTLSAVLGKTTYWLQTTAQPAQDDITGWANGQMVKSWLSRIRGKVKFQGNATITPDSVLEMNNVGARFNGSAYVSGVSHEIVDGNWLTEASLGLSFNWFAENANIDAPPAAGITSAIQGLQAAVVTQIDSDPDGQFRVKVKLPMMQSDGDGVWARLSTGYASSSAGAFFMPEVNDEVIVGFLNNDPRFPVVVGSVYSSQNAAPLTPDKENPTKAIITKNQLKLTFDDKNKNVIIETPGGNKVTLSDQNKSITLADQNSNTVTLDSSGITLDSAKALKLTAQQDITLSSSAGKISLSASAGDVEIAGLNIKESAQVQYSAQGQAQAQVTASGQLTLKGAIVMIN